MREVPGQANDDLVVVAPRIITKRDATFACILAALTAAFSAGLCIAAVLLHPPLAVMPLLVITCVGGPMVGGWELPHAIAALRETRGARRRRAIASFKRSLDRLPETKHPLGR